MPRTRRGLRVTKEQLLAMTRAQQMDVVERFLTSTGLPNGANAGQLYAAVYLPGIARQAGWTGVLARRGDKYYRAGHNSRLDTDNNNDGVIDFNDLAVRISKKRIEIGLGPSPSLSSVEGTGGYVTRTGGTGAISGAYGTRRSEGHVHGGIDISAPAGTPVASLAAGTITRAEFSDSYGNVVYVRQDDGNEVRYAHLRSFAPDIEANRRVGSGQILGYVGSTGRSTGNHLHLEIRNRDGNQINPTATYNRNRWIVGGQTNALNESSRRMFNIPTGYQYEIVTKNGREIPTIVTPNGTRFNFFGTNSVADISNFSSLRPQTQNEIIEYFRLRGR
jgi:murein DD-endopeptidase MepM/ murein hydrolase activator NlpD